MIDDVPQIKLAVGQHKEGIKFRQTFVIAYYARKAKLHSEAHVALKPAASQKCFDD